MCGKGAKCRGFNTEAGMSLISRFRYDDRGGHLGDYMWFDGKSKSPWDVLQKNNRGAKYGSKELLRTNRKEKAVEYVKLVNW
jgi:hypothetical protein